MKQVTAASERLYLCSHPQRKEDICYALKNNSFMCKGRFGFGWKAAATEGEMSCSGKFTQSHSPTK